VPCVPSSALAYCLPSVIASFSSCQLPSWHQTLHDFALNIYKLATAKAAFIGIYTSRSSTVIPNWYSAHCICLCQQTGSSRVAHMVYCLGLRSLGTKGRRHARSVLKCLSHNLVAWPPSTVLVGKILLRFGNCYFQCVFF
jgi:hypothetical protein